MEQGSERVQHSSSSEAKIALKNILITSVFRAVA
jgi:hypothetical protein